MLFSFTFIYFTSYIAGLYFTKELLLSTFLIMFLNYQITIVFYYNELKCVISTLAQFLLFLIFKNSNRSNN